MLTCPEVGDNNSSSLVVLVVMNAKMFVFIVPISSHPCESLLDLVSCAPSEAPPTNTFYGHTFYTDKLTC